MSYQCVRWALDIKGLKNSVKLVLVALADRADETGAKCHPGITELTVRASTNRERVLEALIYLEALGAIEVERGAPKAGKRRAVNQYKLAVGKTIVIPKKPSKKTEVFGPNGDQTEDHIGLNGDHHWSKRGYVTTNERSSNNHSDTKVSAPLHAKRGDEDLKPIPDRAVEGEENPTPDDEEKPFADRGMIAAARAHFADPEHMEGVIHNIRPELVERWERGDKKAREQVRRTTPGLEYHL